MGPAAAAMLADASFADRGDDVRGDGAVVARR